MGAHLQIGKYLGYFIFTVALNFVLPINGYPGIFDFMFYNKSIKKKNTILKSERIYCYSCNLRSGDAYNDRGDYFNAFQAYRDALEQASTRKEKIIACGGLAVTAFKLGDLNRSRQYCFFILRMEPDNKWALNWLKKINSYQRNKTIAHKKGEKLKTKYTNALQMGLKLIDELSKKNMELFIQERFAEALPIAGMVLDLREKIYGPEHLDVAESLNDLTVIHVNLGNYEKAEALHNRAIAIFEKILGPEHIDIATIFNKLGVLYGNLGNYKKAELLYKRALAIREKVLGPYHEDVANSLYNLALLYSSSGKFQKAIPMQMRALDIREKVLGADHLEVALSLNNLGFLYKSLGNHKEALPLYKRALVIRDKILGSNHPTIARNINDLISVSLALKDLEQARELYTRYAALIETNLGLEHPLVIKNLKILADINRNLGNYENALSLYKRILATQEKVLGAEHQELASSLNSLASLYQSQGDYQKALPLLKRALAIREKKQGSEDPNTGLLLNNLALVYHHLGNYQKSEQLNKRALGIFEKVSGPEHPSVAQSLNNLAGLYCVLGKYKEAERMHRCALTIREKAFGPVHADVAQSFNNLAYVYQSSGDYIKADLLYKRALAIREMVLPPKHPDLVTTKKNIEELNRLQNDNSEAVASQEHDSKSRKNPFKSNLPFIFARKVDDTSTDVMINSDDQKKSLEIIEGNIGMIDSIILTLVKLKAKHPEGLPIYKVGELDHYLGKTFLFVKNMNDVNGSCTAIDEDRKDVLNVPIFKIDLMRDKEHLSSEYNNENNESGEKRYRCILTTERNWDTYYGENAFGKKILVIKKDTYEYGLEITNKSDTIGNHEVEKKCVYLSLDSKNSIKSETKVENLSIAYLCSIPSASSVVGNNTPLIPWHELLIIDTTRTEPSIEDAYDITTKTYFLKIILKKIHIYDKVSKVIYFSHAY